MGESRNSLYRVPPTCVGTQGITHPRPAHFDPSQGVENEVHLDARDPSRHWYLVQVRGPWKSPGQGPGQGSLSRRMDRLGITRQWLSPPGDPPEIHLAS